MSAKGIAETLFPKTRLAVLKELTNAVDEGLHLRELERRTGLDSRGLLRELHAMRDAGILAAKRVGRQVIYRLNGSCPIHDELRSIVLKTVGLGDVLREALSPFAERIDLAYVYGSLASGEASAESDVDVMVVGTVTLRELSASLRKAGSLLRREINPTLYQSDEYQEALNTQNSFISRVHQGPRIDLIGAAT
ncbi:nucleotidyltransferase domain-containing protein [Candidatus Bipolaricaulota bacterium]|nr:nucleotidyltransferase domain-containing protein [Candidatus Bipolaricaulota bacterium]